MVRTRELLAFGLLMISAAYLMPSCQTYMLERKLSGDVKQWYRDHSVLMEYQLPEQKITERTYFLKLSDDTKQLYIKRFWDIREVGAEAEWNLRVKVAEKAFRGEGIPGRYTDRGYILLTCGQPCYQEFRNQHGQLYNEGEERWNESRQLGNRFFQLWGYWHGTGFFQQLQWITFEYDIARERWVYRPSPDSTERMFMNYKRWRMAPTLDGWKSWLKEIGQ